MLPPILAGRASHIPLKDLPIVGRGGEPGHACDLRDALSFPQKRQTVLNPQKQDVLEDGHLHIFLEEPAAFALADIHMLGDLIQRKLLGIVFLNKGEDILQPCQMLLGPVSADGKGDIVQVEPLPDSGQGKMYLELIVRRRRL